MRRKGSLLAVVLAISGIGSTTAWAREPASTTYQPSAQNIEARTWFQDAKFGIFIHWGLYSQLAGGGERNGLAEWIMERKQIPISQYERLAGMFNPVRFDADEWVQQIKASGARYITITAKHHDGFALYDSQVSQWDVMDATPFKRDILKELKEACDRNGIKLFFYYSQLDWHHPDYFPRGRTGNVYTGRPEAGVWENYLRYQDAQIAELLTQYGPIGGLWFDGWWDHENTAQRDSWRLDRTYTMIHQLQPGVMIGNNHHLEPFAGEDFQMFEQDLPGENEKGFNTAGISSLPLEMADTMNGTWGFSLTDDASKSTRELIRRMVGAAGRNANYLMNTGPMPDGRLQPENVRTFAEIGKWMRRYGDSIYGARAGPISPRPWGVSTQKQDRVYLHVLNWPGDEPLLVPNISIRSARLLNDGGTVPVTSVSGGLLIQVPEARRDATNTIIELTLR